MENFYCKQSDLQGGLYRVALAAACPPTDNGNGSKNKKE